MWDDLNKLDVLLLVIVILFIWTHGCCIKRVLSGVLCSKCSHCGCKKCSSCGLKQTCSQCVVKSPESECKCSPCKVFKCELKEAFKTARSIQRREGLDEVVIEEDKTAKTAKVEVTSDPTKSARSSQVKVKIPAKVNCNCPKCEKDGGSASVYGDIPSTYYPIYQPMPYGMRY